MNCHDYQQKLSPFLDEQLSVKERAQLEEHLMDCTTCRTELAGLKQLVHSLRAMPKPQTPDLLSGIHQKLAGVPWWTQWAERFTAPWPISLPLHGLALATTALVVIIVMSAQRQPLQLASMPTRQSGGNMQQNKRDDKGLDVLTVHGDRSSFERAKDERLGQPQGATNKLGVLAAVGGHSEEEQSRSRLSGIEPVAAPSAVPVGQGSATPILQVQWRVASWSEAMAKIAEWMRIRGGTMTVVDERHLSITLPVVSVQEFLERFSTNPPPWNPVTDYALPVTISLELILAE